MKNFETNDKVVFKYKGAYEVGVITGKKIDKDNGLSYYIRSEKGSGYSLVPVDKKRRKGTPDYPVIDSAMTDAFNRAVEKGEAKETNLFAKDNIGHTRANYASNIKLSPSHGSIGQPMISWSALLVSLIVAVRFSGKKWSQQTGHIPFCSI